MSYRHYWSLLAALLVTGSAAHARAQGLGDRLKRAAAEAAKRKVEQRVERKAEDATDAALDGAEKGVKAGVKGAAKPDSAGAAAAPVRAPAAPAPAAPAPAAAAPVRTDAGRDFTPGTRVLFATSFARDEIGDFPRAFRLKEGNAEVADVGGTRWLRVTSDGEFEIPLPEVLPTMFTVELDFVGRSALKQEIFFTTDDEAHHVMFRPEEGGIESDAGGRSVSEVPSAREGVPFRVQVMADGDYAKVYVNGVRVANMPNARFGRTDRLRFRVRGFEDAPTLLGDIRVAAGGKDLYAELAAAGRVTADGILFGTNSDRLRKESAPVLQQIADMLRAHPELQLSIEGHTDGVGGDAANQTLSEQRAAAVRAYLVAQHQISAERLTARGFGASKPVAANDDEAGRQRNRRVELVKR